MPVKHFYASKAPARQRAVLTASVSRVDRSSGENFAPTHSPKAHALRDFIRS